MNKLWIAIQAVVFGLMTTFVLTRCAVSVTNSSTSFSSAPNTSTSTSTSAPTAGTAISFSLVAGTTLTVTWGAATDTNTATADLQYKLVSATLTSALDTVSEADAITSGSVLMDWTANTTSKAVTGLTASTTYAFAVLVKNTQSQKALYTPNTQAMTNGRLRIFVSATTNNGNLGGVSGADAICMADANKPSDAWSVKAMLVDGTSRVACTSNNCGNFGVSEHTGWVLAASTAYYRQDGTTLIGTTTAAGVFSFPLNDKIGPSVTTAWTGLSVAAFSWMTSGSTCTGWTVSTGNGEVGQAQDVTSAAINDISTPNCLNAKSLYCVEQ
jgi:hypothetical protein